MNSFTIHPRKAGNWRRHREATLAISVGAPYHEGEKFAATVAWAAQRFDKLHLQVGDTLQRHNSNAPDAETQSRAAGDAWLARNQPIVAATGKLASVTRWDDLRRQPDYPAVHAQFKQAARENTQLAAAISADAARFIARQPTPLPDASARSTAYVLEELAVITLHARAVPGARLYPSPNIESLALVEAGLVPQAPKGLERQQRIHLSIRSKGL